MLTRKKAAHCEVVICNSMNDGVFSAPHEYCTMLCRDRCNILIGHRFLVHRRGVHKCVHPLGYAVHHPSGQLTVMGHQVMNISEIVAMTLGIGCIRPWSGRDLEHCNIHRQFLPRSSLQLTFKSKLLTSYEGFVKYLLTHNQFLNLNFDG